MSRSASLREIGKLLKPGYTFSHGHTGHGVVKVLDPEGETVRLPSGLPLTFAVHQFNGSAPERIEVRQKLALVGALHPDERPQRKAHEQHEPKKVQGEVTRTNPIVMARTTLQDRNATPRERSLARAYLDLMEKHEKLGTVTQRLGVALKQYA